MKANNQIVPRSDENQQKKPSTFFLGKGAVDLMMRSVSDEKVARRILTTVLTVVQNSKKLQECNQISVLNAAIDGEVTKNLSLANGEYAIVPYGKTATMQLMVNGIKKMCIRSCAYQDIGCFDVRDGEFKGYDQKTRRPIIEWNPDTDLREQLPIVGYYAFYQLNEDYNGFTQCLYWTHKQILRHADRYSRAFSLDTWQKMMDGKLKDWEVDKLRNSSPWYGEPNDMKHMKMCQKTVLKQLLSDGFAPKEIDVAVRSDNVMERTGEPIIRDGDVLEDFVDVSEDGPAETTQEAREAPQEPKSATVNETAQPEPKDAKTPKNRAVQPPVIDVEEDQMLPVNGGDEFSESFFQ